MKETDAIDEYILQHIDEESDYLKALYRDTHVKLLRPRMASGHLQGRMLKMFVQIHQPQNIHKTAHSFPFFNTEHKYSIIYLNGPSPSH